MAYSFPAQVKVSPNFSEPDLIVTYAQPSGFMEAFAGGAPRVRLGTDDLYVYINALDIRTQSSAAQFGANWLPSASLNAQYHSTQTYLLRNRNDYDRHMTAAAGRYNVSLPQATELGQRQGIFQQLRSMALYGYNASNNEGLLNTQGATAVTLPADPQGNTTVLTYDNGAMYQFLLTQILSLKTRMYQSGGAQTAKITIVGPQRELLLWQYSVVQVTSYQRQGAGTATIASATDQVGKDAGDTIEWAFDDTLIGKGAGGTDLIIITAPEIQTPDISGIDTGEFNEVKPSTDAVNVLYTDVAAPIKIQTPIPDGGITQVLEMRATSGWNWRPQGLSLISMQYQ